MLFVLTGPESTAKSDLSLALSQHYAAPLVLEVARDYLRGRESYQPSDLLEIAQVQRREEAAAGPGLVFADTDLQVIHIWWQERFGPVPPSIRDAYQAQGARHYLLCKPDVPWAADPLRENPHDRERLYGVYEADLSRRGLAYSVVGGLGNARLKNALDAVSSILSD